MKPLTKILILVLIIGVFGYLAFQVFGGTTFNKTLDRGNTDLEDGLVGHWSFDGGDLINNVADSSGQGYTGYLSGFSATTTTSGQIGQALEFDGTDDYVNVGASYNGVKTVAFWVKSDSTSEDIIDLNNPSAGWFNSNYTYCQPITINNSQVATTTTNGFVILATTTQTTLAATSSAGTIQKLDSNNNLPFDIIYTSGTDCNSAGGSLLDFHHESYASTTGALVSWIEVTDISSTTDKTFLMYYGNSSATDQSNEAGTYNSTYQAVWHLGEDPSINTDGTCGGGADEVCDSTANNYDLDSTGAMTTADQVTGYISGSIEFDGSNDRLEVNSASFLPDNGNKTISVWAEVDTFGETDTYLGNAAATSQRFYIGTKSSAISVGAGNAFPAVTALSTTAGWHQFVLVQTSSTNVDVYQNGAYAGSETFGGSTATDVDFYIGSGGGGSNAYADDKIDEARVYNTAIHAMDILTDYNNQVNVANFLTYGSEETQSVGSDITLTNGYISANTFTSPTIYVDGTASSTLDTGWHHVVITTGTGINASALDIGRIASSYLDGKLDDVRIYNRALSADEITRLYHLGATTKINKTIQSTGSPLEDGLVGHWTFDGPNLIQNAGDSSGQGDTGYLTNFTSTTTATGSIGQAIEFDGSDDYVDMGASYNGVKTVAFWVKGDSTTEKVIDLNGTESVEITNGYISANGFTSPTIYVDGTASSTLDTGWHHVVITTGTSINASALKVGQAPAGGGATTVCSDAFTDTAGTDLVNHTPTTAGTGWTVRIDTSAETPIEVISNTIGVDQNAPDAAELYTCDYTSVGADQEVIVDATDINDVVDAPIHIVGRYQDTSNFYGVRMTRNSTEKAQLYKFISGTETILDTTTNAVSIGSTVKLEMIGTALKVYIDDVEEASATDSAITAAGPGGIGLGDVSSHAGADDISNANRMDNFVVNETAAESYFDGKLDDVRIYNRALSADEANRLYHLGATTKINKTIQSTNSPLEDGLVGHWTFDGPNLIQNAGDSSGQGNTGYLSGFTSTTTAPGKTGQALEFDGSDDYIRVSENESYRPANITVNIWVKPSTSGQPDWAHAICLPYRTSGWTDPYTPYCIGRYLSGSYTDFTITVGGVDYVANDSGGTEWNSNSWFMATLTYDGETIRSYINGVLAGSNTTPSGDIDYSGGNTDLGFGTRSPHSNGEYFKGLLDDARIYNRVLSADEISRLYEMTR